MDAAELPSPSPSQFKPASTLFKDISNFKTPNRRPSRISDFNSSPCPQFFTATKQTPRTHSSSLRRRPPPSSAARSNAVRRLKAVELEQSQSSRKVQIRKEQSLKSLAKSLTVWLNFLFENPRSCGCNFPVDEDHGQTVRKGKRDSGSGVEVRVDAAWRDPKRCRHSSWRGGDSESAAGFSSSKYSKLQSSLKLVCSFDDLIQRMRFYLSLGSCREVFDSMIQVSKNIDEGRLKMKVHCPLVTDVGLTKKAIRVLLSYNPIWLRIGLYIIFGGDSLLSDRDVNSDEEVAFLKMIIEKQLFAHAGLAKEYAYNKKVEGLYRPGYYEALGNVILKRFLLLVIILDRAKSQSCLSLKYGLDGVDGGSPLLFAVQSSIKSSHQVIHDFLSSDVMLGEGNVAAHLVILGYKVSHQQSPIVDFDFRVTDLFADLQDGMRLCRAIQLLQDDSSILLKMAIPSDTRKKHLANCGTALQYLKEAGVVLDDDGMMIVEDDIADGDKELTIVLLWNMFVQLQLPLLVKKTTLADEICKIRGNMDSCINVDAPSLDMLLSWIQAICEIYDCKIDNFSSLVDGKAIWCLLDYHFRKQLCCSWSSKDHNKSSNEESIMLASEYSDAVHNFLLSQKLMSLLGNFPEVLQISDILEYNGVPNDRSVVILLVFLSSQLVGKKNMDQLNFHKLLGCDCQSSERICSAKSELAHIPETSVQCTEDTGSVRNFKAIQAWWKDMAEKNHKLPKLSAQTLQNLTTNKDENNISRVNAAIVVQRYTRGWLARSRCIHARSRCIHGGPLIHKSLSMVEENDALDVRTRAAAKIQDAWNYYVCHSYHNKHFAAVKIQSHFRTCLLRRRLHSQRRATIKIQSFFRMSRCWKTYQQYKIATVSATIIQSYVRGWVARREANQCRHLIVTIQRYCRGWLRRRHFLCQRKAVVKIQSTIQCLLYRQAFQRHRQAAVEIQRIVRGKISRSNLLGASCLHPVIPHDYLLNTTSAIYSSVELNIVFCSVLKLQRWWRSALLLKLRTKSAVLIQSHIRDWLARQKASRERHSSIVIQSHWRGYQARRKESREQLKDLRLRVQKSSISVDDSMRIINRLVAALSELLKMKSISNILHTCATLDMATRYSQKCCERLVDAGAIKILLKLIHSGSRSIPDQEVLKHALSTLRNLARYPNLVEVLIDCEGSVETVLWEFLRNKEEGYFIASELLKKICYSSNGAEAVRKLPAHLKRLRSLVEELSRIACNEKRNARFANARENAERRLKEAVVILKMATEN
ncbi:uncharacterized protein LOC126789497 [Argentina anserina]|uniref:uncharacterized protein LOC126789497 n=1 Tax=Argentina anserina TaxID=57926 RepID=UPI0021762A5C|nr:uncharacterized protein LOC126789497 [Potentilla anserina]